MAGTIEGQPIDFSRRYVVSFSAWRWLELTGEWQRKHSLATLDFCESDAEARQGAVDMADRNFPRHKGWRRSIIIFKADTGDDHQVEEFEA